jgi:Protein of unknown function (DUF3305)
MINPEPVSAADSISQQDPLSIRVAVVLERLAKPNAWEDWHFRLLDVVPDEGQFGLEPRALMDDGRCSRWLYPAFELRLFADECKGYFLNLTSGSPSWFVSWREREGDASQVEVSAVSVSYIEADRRLFAEERVESVPLAPELCEWLQDFTNRHFRPDSARRQRAQSFLSPQERQRAAREVVEQGLPDPDLKKDCP